MAEFTLERTTSIAAPAAAVYDEIVDLRRWQQWSPWEGRDPNLERTYSDATSGAGARYAWKGNRKVGQGHMTITQVEPEALVQLDLVFEKPMKAENVTRFELTEVDDHTVVRWVMTGEQNLMGKILAIAFPIEKLVGPDFEEGLANLKALVERETSAAA